MKILKDFYEVKSRFHRSVQIELDKSLDGYILTQAGIKVIERIVKAQEQVISTKAFSIIGPYGSGKSAFIVFLKSLLGPKNEESVKSARLQLSKENKKLYSALFEGKEKLANSKRGYCPALVSAGRERLEYSILKGLYRGLDNFHRNDPSKRRPQIIKELEESLRLCESGKVPSHDTIIKYCFEAIKYIKSEKGAGILLVIDELGKTLETAALDPTNDIFILQKLAEIASRTTEIPFLLFTVLHQSFDRYALKLASDKRNEWSKIQGRFEDVSFIDSSEQIFKLISTAIQPLYDRKTRLDISDNTENVFSRYSKVFSEDHLRSSRKFIDLLQECLPIHPLTMMVLVPLFRSRFSQNERSLFAFLTSTEPRGFVDYLSKTPIDDLGQNFPFYSLDYLYDYFISNFGASLFTHQNGRQWVEIDNALSRSNDELERKIIKAVGILSLLGDTTHLSVNDEVLYCALDVRSKSDESLVKEALKALCRKSVLVFRRYAASYRIWGGSDIDIEEKINETKKTIISSINITEALNKQFPLRPKIAKRHLYKTGTLRFFKIRYIRAEDLESELRKEISDCDGQILLALQTDSNKIPIAKFKDALDAAPKEISARTLIGITSHAEYLTDYFSELLSLQWIKKNTPELQGDRIACRELDARLVDIESNVLRVTEELFFPVDMQASYLTKWIDINQERKRITKREMSVWISLICDRVYHKAPILKNELINRQKTSSTSSSARRILMQNMLEWSDKERIGIEGFPPEYSMYLSILQTSGLHKKDNEGQYGFTSEGSTLSPTWRPLWNFLNQYLEKNSYRKVKLTELYDFLQKPPFGIRESVLPVLFLALIISHEDEIALFDQGTFMPQIKSHDLEILVKLPRNYEIQVCQIKGVKADIFEQIVNSILMRNDRQEVKDLSILDIVKALCHFVRTLPEFVNSTSHISDRAKAVRKCLLETKEPANLLFRDLPKACGFEEVIRENHHDKSLAEAYVTSLKTCLTELRRKEADLYGQIERVLFQAFEVHDHGKQLRDQIRERSNMMISVTLDSMFKGFLVRVSDNLDYKAWLESIGTVINGKPPLYWNDEELLRFEHEMTIIHSKIKKYERLALEVGKRSKNIRDEIAQISITSNQSKERSQIYHINESDKEIVEALSEKFKKVMEEFKDKDLLLAALSKSLEGLLEVENNKQKQSRAYDRE